MTEFSYCVYPEIRKSLRNKGCSRIEFAQNVGISGSNAWWWLTGQNKRTIKTIQRILKETGLTFEEAFG